MKEITTKSAENLQDVHILEKEGKSFVKEIRISVNIRCLDLNISVDDEEMNRSLATYLQSKLILQGFKNYNITTGE